MPTDSPYPNSTAECDPALLDRLRSLEGEGWVLAYTTRVPAGIVYHNTVVKTMGMDGR